MFRDKPDPVTGIEKPDKFDHLIEKLVHLNDAVLGMAQLVQTNNGATLAGSDPHLYAGPMLMYRGVGLLAGLNFRETSGAAPAVVRILDGTDTGGKLLYTYGLLAGASVSQTFPNDGGISFTTGLYVQVTGTVEGVLYRGTGRRRSKTR